MKRSRSVSRIALHHELSERRELRLERAHFGLHDRSDSVVAVKRHALQEVERLTIEKTHRQHSVDSDSANLQVHFKTDDQKFSRVALELFAAFRAREIVGRDAACASLFNIQCGLAAIELSRLNTLPQILCRTSGAVIFAASTNSQRRCHTASRTFCNRLRSADRLQSGNGP